MPDLSPMQRPAPRPPALTPAPGLHPALAASLTPALEASQPFEPLALRLIRLLLSQIGFAGTCPARRCRRDRACVRPAVTVAQPFGHGERLPPCIAGAAASSRQPLDRMVRAMVALVAPDSLPVWPTEPKAADTLRGHLLLLDAVMTRASRRDEADEAARLDAWLAADPDPQLFIHARRALAARRTGRQTAGRTSRS